MKLLSTKYLIHYFYLSSMFNFASTNDMPPKLLPSNENPIKFSRLTLKPLTLEDILPEDRNMYDKMSSTTGTELTLVEFHVTVMSLDSIDESSMTYVADIFFAKTWQDYRLNLTDNMTTKYRLLPVAWLDEVWRPDSSFKNAKKVAFQDMTIPNLYVWLYRSKRILYMVKLNLLLSCAMNFKYYPHDPQSCAIKIESWESIEKPHHEKNCNFIFIFRSSHEPSFHINQLPMGFGIKNGIRHLIKRKIMDRSVVVIWVMIIIVLSVIIRLVECHIGL